MMLQVELDSARGITVLRPHGPLTEDDFTDAAKIIDPHIEESGGLEGLIIETKDFPGWESFSSLLKHLRFIREHQKKVKRVAFVSDSAIGNFAESVGRHFVSAEIRHFAFVEQKEALSWVTPNA